MKSQVQLRQFRAAKVVPEFVAFAGGVDAETPPLFVKPGFARESQNYECDVNGGYARVMGYERYDGQTSPSDGAYAVITATITGTIAVGDTVTGATSGATAVVIARPAGEVVVTKITNTFQNPEDLTVGAVVQAATTSLAVTDGAATPLLHATYKNLAADEYRDDIAAIPGSGNVLGFIKFGGVGYGFRNNAGGTAAAIYKTSVSGWTAVTLFNEISFTVGAVAVPAEGATLTQGGVTATLKRLVLTSGTFAGGNAAGRFIISNPAGGDFAAGAATLTGGVTCTLSAIQTAITLLPDGRYEFRVENFGGSVATRRIYGCDGVNRGFEFDGTVFVPITTGMTTDTPNHVFSHKNQLFFSFGASVQHAAPGTPYIWSVLLGVTEIAMGDTVTGFMSQPGTSATSALAIFTRNRCSILYGSGVSTWDLVPYRDEVGAYAYTIADIGNTIFLDDRGVTSFQTSQAFGNFAHFALSNRLRTWVKDQRTKSTAACISRDKAQYRLFFSDGYALFVTMNGSKLVGMMQILFPKAVRCVWSSEESDGSETIYFGSTDGMVYQMEKGTSFDGDAIEHYLHLSYLFSKSPRFDKTYHNCTLEISGTGYASLSFTYQLGYGSTDIEQPGSETGATNFSAGRWDIGNWDTGFWDGRTLEPSHFDMVGTAENVSIMIRGNSDMDASVRYSGALINHSPRQGLR